ncbi:MAG: hypothetical protein ABFD69_02285 [Candidatus Sumerlaeia bacterium]
MRFEKLAALLLFAAASMSSVAADFSAWKQRMPIALGRVDRRTIGLLPVDATVSLKAADMADPQNPGRELRLVYRKNAETREIPFQLSRASVWDGDSSPSVPTFNARLTFFPADGDQAGTYELLYGNADARPTSYTTDLEVGGEGPHWTIENSLMTARLRAGDTVKRKRIDDRHADSGQLGSVTLKSRPATPITNQQNLLHWNPGVYIPRRGWVQAYAWDPPPVCEIERGPIFVEVRRGGPLPTVPEVELSITYRFFRERSFVEVSTRMDIVEDLGVVALRNNECIFNENLFTRMAWEQFGEVHDEPIAGYKPANKHGDLVRLKPDTPWFALYQPDSRIGVATVFASECNLAPRGGAPAQFEHAFSFTREPRDRQVFWSRPQILFAKEWDRKQLITVPKGSVYAEQNYYFFYDTEKAGPVDAVRRLSRAVQNPPDVKIGPYPFAPPK